MRVKPQGKPPQTRAAFARQASGEPLGRSGLAGSPRTRQTKEETPKGPKQRLSRRDAPFQCLPVELTALLPFAVQPGLRLALSFASFVVPFVYG
ncbi:hypothetical protein Chor_010805 [Crotalus horridus]